MAFQILDGEIGEVTHDDRNTYSVHTEVTIDAPPEKVWAVLTDFDKLAEWSSSFVAFEGEFRKDDNFGFEVPTTAPDVADLLLDPRRTWADKAAYDAQAEKLVNMFADNFQQYLPFIDDDVKAAAIG